MQDDFGQCMVSNSRMAARAITRRYDAYVRPYGLTATQLSLLGSIKDTPRATVSQLAEARGFDRTTLTRNLDRMEALGFVESQPAERGNGRLAEVTPKGEALFAEVLPLWRQAQAEMRAELSREGFDGSLAVLQRLAKL